MAYVVIAALAGSTGFARFMMSRKLWKTRILLGSVLFSGLAGVMVTGIVTWQTSVKASDNPFGYVAIAIFINQFSPNVLQAMSKKYLESRGIKILEKDAVEED